MSAHLSVQIKRFLITGFSAAGIDFCVYTLMLYFGLDYNPAKACGFLAAVAFAYNGHRRWTFTTHGSKKRITAFSLLYVTTFTINISTNWAVLEFLGKDSKPDVVIAFCVATGITAVINFTMMKFVIFRRLPEIEVGSEEAPS